MEYIVDPAVYWKEVAKLRRWHPCTWLQNTTSVPMNNALIGSVSIVMLLLDVWSPRRWASGVISARVYWRYLNYSVRRLCLSRGLEWVSVFTLDDKVLPLGSSFIELCTSPYSITTYWRTYRFQSTLSPLQIPTYPSPPQSRPQAHSQRYTQQFPPIISYLLISAHIHHPDPKQSPRNLEWLVFTRLFYHYKYHVIRPWLTSFARTHNGYTHWQAFQSIGDH